jgi:hypothetical protein
VVVFPALIFFVLGVMYWTVHVGGLSVGLYSMTIPSFVFPSSTIEEEEDDEEEYEEDDEEDEADVVSRGEELLVDFWLVDFLDDVA